MVFADNHWMTSLSGSFSVPSILPNAERYWFSLLVLYVSFIIYYKFSVELDDLEYTANNMNAKNTFKQVSAVEGKSAKQCVCWR